MLYLTNDDVDRLVTPADALAAVRDGFQRFARGDAAVQPRARTSVGEVKLSTLGAVLGCGGDDVLGAKVYATVGGRFTFLVVLFAASDGRRLALVEAEALTRLRAAATSVLAAQLLARPDARRLVVFGTGVQAQGHVEAFTSGLGIREVTLVARRDPGPVAEKLAARVDATVWATTDGPAAVAGADLVVTATRATAPLFAAGALPDGVHLTAVGSTRLDAHELDDGTYGNADRVVVEWKEQIRHEAGGLAQAVTSGSVRWETVVDLADLVAGRAPGRSRPTDRTLFQSVGIGLEDIAVAALAWRNATRG